MSQILLARWLGGLEFGIYVYAWTWLLLVGDMIHLGVPEEIRRRPPTTDTWSLAQLQDEFYFSLPYREMDLCLYGLNNGIAAFAVAQAAGLSVEQVERVWGDIAAKRRATAYLHEPPLLVEPLR